MAIDLTNEQLIALNEKLRDYGDLVSSVTAGERIRRSQEETAAEKKAKIDQNYYNAGVAATASLKAFGNSLLSTETGMSKYNASLSTAGNAALDIGKNFGLLGFAVGGLIKLFTSAAEAVLKQNDSMLKASDSLAEFGATGSITAKQIMDMGLAAGYSSEMLNKWTDITKSLGTDIIGLSATVTGGVGVFAGLTKVTQSQINHYQDLGVSQEQLNKNQADYIKLQVQSGLQITARMIQDGSLKKASLEYTNNLLELSAITGLNAEQAKKAMEMATADLAVETKLANLQDEQIRLAEMGKKPEADRIEAQIKATRQFLAVASTVTDAAGLAGIQSMVATGNFNELSAGFAAGVPGILEFIKGIDNGSKKPEQFAKFFAEATDRTRKSLGDAIVQDKEIGKSFAYSREALANAGKFRGKTEEEISVMIKQDMIDREKTIKEGSKEDQKLARNAQLETEKLARAGVQELVGLINGPLTNAFTKLQETLNMFGRGLARWSDQFLGTDIAKLFETPAEIQEKITKSSAGLAETAKLIDEAKKTIAKNPIADQQLEVATKELNDKKAKLASLDMMWQKEQDIQKKREIHNTKILAEEEVRNAKIKQSSAERARTSLNFARGGDPVVKLIELQKRELAQKIELAKLNDDLYKKNLETGVKQAPGRQGGATAEGREAYETRAPASTLSYLQKISKAESGGSNIAKNPESTATGKYQFTADTWKGMVAKLGLDYSLEDRKDPTKAEEVVIAFTEQNRKQLLKGIGHEPSDTELYMAHFLGAGGATSFLNAMKENPNLSADRVVDASALASNKSIFYKDGASRTLQDVFSIMERKVPQARDGGIFSGPESGFPVELHGNEVVTPFDPSSALAKLMLAPASESAAILNPTKETTPNVNANAMGQNTGALLEMVDMLSTKFDQMIDKLTSINDTETQILRHARA